MTAMIYMIFFCVARTPDSGSCVENGGFTFESRADCVSYMARLGVGHEASLIGARLYIGHEPYDRWYECEKRPVSQWEPVQ
jgi:hypothetical protein